jgi:hypothetical protein
MAEWWQSEKQMALGHAGGKQIKAQLSQYIDIRMLWPHGGIL